MRISDWSSDVCSSDLALGITRRHGPPSREALQAFCVFDTWGSDSSTLHVPDCGGRRDMQSRATLERRNCVSRPADAAISFSPIKSDVSGVGLKLGCAVDAMKKRSAWISIQHPANEDTPTTVRKPELARIHYAISQTIEIG